MRLLLIVAALVLLIGALMLATPPTSSFTLNEDLTTSELRAKLERDIRQDAGASYTAFKERYEHEDFEITHGAAHLFGEILFEAAGVENVLVCDTDMNFGCYHGFVRAAVSSLGLEVIASLDAVCSSIGASGAPVCQHGIGHGILEYVGHTNLADALDACASLDQPDPLAGCSGGVFMEYNVPFSIGERGEFQIAARPLIDLRYPYAPCDTLENAAFSQSCYHELPQWWKQVYPEDYAEFGRFCQAVPERLDREACMGGIAKIIPQAANYEVEASATLCALLPGERAYGDCVVQAAWAIRANERDHERAKALCALAPRDMQEACPT
jgi:hypothetical protein